MGSSLLKNLSLDNIILRKEPLSKDRVFLKELLLSTGVFFHHEIEVAIELVNDRLIKGDESEYLFIFADKEDGTVGYICYGPITMTEERFDINWIVVRKDMQSKGIGSLLLGEAEKHIKELSGTYIFIETSSRDVYKPTRDFYRKYGYLEVARIPDYYSKDDDKVVFMKSLV